MSSLYEYYITNDDSASIIEDGTWIAQTFTVIATGHTITSVKLKLYRVGNPGTVTVSIRNTSGNHPTGSDLTIGTIDGNSLTTNGAGAWYEIALTEYTVGINKFAIVVRAPNGDGSNYVAWKFDWSSPTYDGGNEEYSGNSGDSWASDLTADFMFEVWGNALRREGVTRIRIVDVGH